MVESPEVLRSFRGAVLGFYDGAARPLPWRRTRDPYAIWVSEVMAQQTRVETVVPYYRRWLDRFPTVEALAAAPIDAVLKVWEGLGYYARARNLHRAAGVVVETLGGTVPDSCEGLRALPGIGDYTAGAIASIAFGRAVPAVDGNVRRVYARLADAPAPGAAEVRGWAARVVDPRRPGDFNQALMELGATVCTPRNPECDRCPVAAHCGALAAGTVLERPAPAARASVRQEARSVGVFVRVGEAGRAGGLRVLMRRRPPTGLLAGLWEFPSVPLGTPADDRAPRDAVRDAVHALAEGLELELEREDGEALAAVRHQFTHLHVTYWPRLVGVQTGSGGHAGDDVRWIALDKVGELAVPVAQQRITALALARLASPDQIGRQ